MTDCAAPRHDEAEPEPAAPSARLCYRCTSRLRRDLHAMPQLYAELGDILDPHGSGPGDGDGNGLPYNAKASEARSQIEHDLAWWAVAVAGERERQLAADIRVPALAGWLHAQVQWASFRPWAGEMAGAFASDRGRARSLLDPHPVAAFPVPRGPLNHCPACNADGLLRAVVHAEAGDPRTRLGCSGCGREWNVTQWLRLGTDILKHAGTAA